jgi:hypothetical protein
MHRVKNLLSNKVTPRERELGRECGTGDRLDLGKLDVRDLDLLDASTGDLHTTYV